MWWLLFIVFSIQLSWAGSVIRVPNNELNRKIISDLELDHGCMGTSPEYLHFHLDEEAKRKLSANITYQKILTDRSETITQEVESQFEDILSKKDLGIYHTIQEMDSALREAAQKYPELVELLEVGTTFEGRTIYALELSAKSSDKIKKNFLVTGTHHAREWISTEVPLGFIKDILSKHEADSEAQKILSESRIVVIPMLNKDGGFYSRTKHKMWRKNRRPAESGKGIGVDNNRNYSYKWGASGASSYPWSDTYKGPTSMSESENQIIERLQKKYKFTASLSFHSYSELVLWPWSYTDSIQSKDHKTFKYYGSKLAEILNYRPIQSADLYPAAGDSDDYLYAVHGVLAYTIELGRSFVPKESEVPEIISKNNQAMRWFFQNAREPFEKPSDGDLGKVQQILERLIYEMHQKTTYNQINQLLSSLSTYSTDMIQTAMDSLKMKPAWRFRVKKALLQSQNSEYLSR